MRDGAGKLPMQLVESANKVVSGFEAIRLVARDLFSYRQRKLHTGHTFNTCDQLIAKTSRHDDASTFRGDAG